MRVFCVATGCVIWQIAVHEALHCHPGLHEEARIGAMLDALIRLRLYYFPFRWVVDLYNRTIGHCQSRVRSTTSCQYRTRPAGPGD